MRAGFVFVVVCVHVCETTAVVRADFLEAWGKHEFCFRSHFSKPAKPEHRLLRCTAGRVTTQALSYLQTQS